jgi:hypothetical protein
LKIYGDRVKKTNNVALFVFLWLGVFLAQNRYGAYNLEPIVHIIRSRDEKVGLLKEREYTVMPVTAVSDRLVKITLP